ncbi:hypothetical protein [Roseovarius pacificus]|uniref:hypothetical protein n=1 Tax=Roseovarius pacificus TaxID=337701 RepID=UPI002A18C093|nr:hypothetical protein [Roseovarius pacificus]
METVEIVQSGPAIWAQVIQLATVFAAFLAAMAAYLSARESRRSADISERHSAQSMTNEILQMHINFQTEIRSLQRLLPAEVNDAGWEPTREEKRVIRMYWYAVFDEWLATIKLGANTQHIWSEYYRNGVKGALLNQAFENELRDMLTGSTTFLGRPKEFTDELSTIYYEVHGKSL